MINIDLHKSIFISILRDIYSDTSLRTILGFKGGTAAMLFYNLPRFSIDLDFDLLNYEKKDEVFIRIKSILNKYGVLSEALEKKYTLFFLLNYKNNERNLKIEISKRSSKAEFIIKNYLGISMLVMKKEDMVAMKLSALLTRKNFATRDIFDMWFFLKDNWEINEVIVKEKANMTLLDALIKAKEQIKTIKKTDLLSGLGELVDNKQKVWVKENLIDEVIFELSLYQQTHGVNMV